MCPTIALFLGQNATDELMNPVFNPVISSSLLSSVSLARPLTADATLH